MTQPLRHLPAGDFVIACCHVKTSGKNEWVRVMPFDEHDDYQQLMLAVPETAQADWIMLCKECDNSKNADHGAPYKKFQLGREVSLGG